MSNPERVDGVWCVEHYAVFKTESEAWAWRNTRSWRRYPTIYFKKFEKGTDK